MKTQLLGLLAETSIHPGAGQSTGVIDLPVAREAATDYPVIPGSSFKGALLNYARQQGVEPTKLDHIFGRQESAGAMLVSDVRLLLLPVRSLNSNYKWVTCPHLLERLARDCERSGKKPKFARVEVATGSYLGAGGETLFLEERQFTPDGDVPTELVETLGAFIANSATRERLNSQLVVLHDDDFTWFARYGLAVQARNELDEKKTSQNLWYEETIPPDTLFYSLLADRYDDGSSLQVMMELLQARPYLQAGGNETIGMGWFAITVFQGKGGAA